MTRRNICLLLACIFFIGIPGIARAAAADTGIKSKGNIIYESSAGSVKLYAEDIALLQEKISSIPEEIFDPYLYSHSHQWEYLDVTKETHKKHCSACGSAYDVINPHTAALKKECNITYDGKEYSGYENACVCGYRWAEEMGHTIVYNPKDERCHTITCELAGTQYCIGKELQEEAHGFNLYPIDQNHHQNVCDTCDYKEEQEECTFDEEIIMEDTGEKRKYCICGNYSIIPDPGEVTEPENPDPEIEEGNTEITPSESVSGNQNVQDEKGGAE